MERTQQSAGLLIIGGALLAIGSFLAWGTVLGALDISGIDGGDGWMTLVGGLVLAGVGFMAFQNKSTPKWLGWAGLIVGLGVALLNFFDIAGTAGVSIGIGMWLMLLGSAAALVGLIMQTRS